MQRQGILPTGEEKKLEVRDPIHREGRKLESRDPVHLGGGGCGGEGFHPQGKKWGGPNSDFSMYSRNYLFPP